MAPATTANMGPGFDCFGLALNIYNTIKVELLESRLQIENIGPGSEQLKTDGQNLVYRAVHQLFKTVNFKPGGLRIVNRFNIPLSSGLGSSSAAIVGGLVAANELIEQPLDKACLLHLAQTLENHPDNISPCMLGGFVISAMSEGKLFCQKMQFPTDLSILVTVPNFPVSTDKARQLLPKRVSLEDAVFNISRSGLLVAGLLLKNYELLSISTEDRLHQPYRKMLVPGLQEAFLMARSTGAVASFLSGSGPAVVAFYKSMNQRQAIARMKEVFKRYGAEAEVYVCEADREGAKIVT
jgi:homoserine kinase